MRSLVVLCTVFAAVTAAPQLFTQLPNSPAVLLDAFGRPLDTAEVASARALHYQAKALEGHLLKKRSIGHAVAYALPAAVSHQSRVDVRSSPAIVAATPVLAESVVAVEPVVQARTVVGPATVYTGGAAVSHQSRVDVRTSPAVVASAPVVAAPAVVAAPVVEARSIYAGPVATVYAGGAAVSHQSRFDVHSSPAVVTEQFVAPAVVEARSVYTPTVYSSTW